jgi:uncharacterized protein YkwD
MKNIERGGGIRTKKNMTKGTFSVRKGRPAAAVLVLFFSLWPCAHNLRAAPPDQESVQSLSKLEPLKRADSIRRILYGLLNEEKARRGLNKLRLNRILSETAQRHSREPD